jgi:hypothetical protein
MSVPIPLDRDEKSIPPNIKIIINCSGEELKYPLNETTSKIFKRIVYIQEHIDNKLYEIFLPEINKTLFQKIFVHMVNNDFIYNLDDEKCIEILNDLENAGTKLLIKYGFDNEQFVNGKIEVTTMYNYFYKRAINSINKKIVNHYDKIKNIYDDSFEDNEDDIDNADDYKFFTYGPCYNHPLYIKRLYYDIIIEKIITNKNLGCDVSVDRCEECNFQYCQKYTFKFNSGIDDILSKLKNHIKINKLASVDD